LTTSQCWPHIYRTGEVIFILHIRLSL
jgi:hypothetical protein